MGFGNRYRVTLFGSSHGPEVGAVVEGLPEGTPVDLRAIQAALDRRRPLGRTLASRRREPDELVVDSGVHAGRADGGPIRMHVANVDVRPASYSGYARTPRPGHADYPARVRFGPEADLSGGGIFSGRMTVGLVIAGALARGLLGPRGIDVLAYTVRIGPVSSVPPSTGSIAEWRSRRDAHEIGALDLDAARAMAEAIASARRDGDSLGGVIEARADGVPVGLGEPFFDSIESELAHLLFSIPAVKGVEFGAGFGVAGLRGSENNDPFFWDADGRVATRTNHAGGILGGLATGGPIVLRAAVKPTSSIARPQETVDLLNRERATVVVKGRHDPCIVPRAVPVVEGCLAIGLTELLLRGGL
jgi:chorismate synthase